MEANVTTLVLEIHSTGSIIHGRVYDGSGPGRRFTGWLGVAAALEQALRSSRGSAAGQAVNESVSTGAGPGSTSAPLLDGFTHSAVSIDHVTTKEVPQ